MSATRKNNITLNRQYIQFAAWLAAFVIAAFAFSILVVKNFADPLAGSGDTNSWEYIGFYLKTNYKFGFWPQLDLVGNQVFYPYGTNSVFQSWGIERDIFYAVLSSLFGSGGWLQIYYFLTVSITGIGTFTLLLHDYGFPRAGGASFWVFWV